MKTMMRRGVWTVVMLGLLVPAREAAAQLDPLLYVKRNRPNILLAVDTSDRMQRDVNGDYRDANIYLRRGGGNKNWEDALLIDDTNTSRNYRRKYVAFAHIAPVGGDKFSADHIEITGDRDAAYGTFDQHTRMYIARRALFEAVTRNTNAVRFGLFRTRQLTPQFLTPKSTDSENPPNWTINEAAVTITSALPVWANQTTNGDSGGGGKWRITRSIVGASNGSIGGPVGPLVAADAVNANTSVLTTLNLSTGAVGSLIPAGRDDVVTDDAPLDTMLDDLKFEANRLINADTDCRNTVVVMVVGGGRGTSTVGSTAAKAAQFLNIGGHRVPIYVIGIAPFTAAERTELETIASTTGGRFTEITPAMFTAVTVGQPIPDLVQAVNRAVANAFVAQVDFDKAPDAGHPYGYETEHQVTSPIVGTTNLEGANDMSGGALSNTVIYHPVTNEKIPQRSNLIVTTGFALPNFDGKLRAFRVYKPVADSSKSIGYKFVADGSKVWVASAPAAATRNIYTSLPNGSVVAFTSTNAALLRAYLKMPSVAAAASLIDYIRSQPLGAFIGSTPAVMDGPSLDPPPDADYPGFRDNNKNRRGMVWIGANDGMLHGIDARLGVEVWAFIPFNLLPKLSALQSGQPVGDFRYYVDGSPKVADVKVGGQWRTYLVMGEGAGGTFYQTFDVTLDNIDSTVAPESDDISAALTYFSTATSVPLKWSFPRYSNFDVNIGTWGDIAATAPAVEKTVGETWSDPAVGQVGTQSSPYVVLTGSGFMKWSVQQQANRGGIVAGTTFYILDVTTGNVLDSRSVGNDNKGETIDNCAAPTVNNCQLLKNALQADPVATGAADSRFITKTYIGDLDGKIWRFDVGLDGANVPKINALVSLFSLSTGGNNSSDHPVFSSMAIVSVGAAQNYLFVGSGSDLMPRNGISTQYALFVIKDLGASGQLADNTNLPILLEKTDGVAGDEKVSAFPAVAGDIVFFSTTTYKATGCALPDANLYAFTFIGGAAYDTNGDGTLTGGGDSTKIRSVAGSRGTAPFIVDQHLAFGVGGKVEMFGDPQDFNNGVGQAGVRILSWREVR